MKQYISDKDIIWLLRTVIESFSSSKTSIGLPLGNLTSQLLVNDYMNEFDQFVKHNLRAKHYIRYADDFVFLSRDRRWVEEILPKIECFLYDQLKLQIHPNKVYIRTLTSGVDFLGWVNFPNHRILRTTTKNRMLKRIKANSMDQTILSYLGLLKHGNGFKLTKQVLDSRSSQE